MDRARPGMTNDPLDCWCQKEVMKNDPYGKEFPGKPTPKRTPHWPSWISGIFFLIAILGGYVWMNYYVWDISLAGGPPDDIDFLQGTCLFITSIGNAILFVVGTVSFLFGGWELFWKWVESLRMWK